MMRNVVRTALLALALASSPALAATDFSGTWVLDPAKSDFGAGAAAAKSNMAKVTLVIKQTPTTLTTERKVGDQTGTAIQKLDGSPSVNKTPSGADVTSTSTWVGNTLTTKSKAVIQGTPTESSEVRSLGDGGKTMVIEITRHAPRGEVKQRLVYNRQ
jgi:hypothetical protein